MNITWKEQNSFHYCFIGKIKVASVSWNDFKSRNDVGIDYRYKIDLPGFKNEVLIGAVATIDDAKQTVENVVKRWFELANA